MNPLCLPFLMLITLCTAAAGEAMALSADTAAQAAPSSNRLVVVDFTEYMNLDKWEVEDDVVMGGRSQGAFRINEEGHAVFTGTVSLENDGGFSSVQYYFAPMDVSAYRNALLRIKGDAKRYRFLVESESGARHYYVYEFETTGKWQTVRIPLREMYPVSRGDRLNMPDYPAESLAMVRIMIANGRAETFRLEIDSISLE
jgi:NADH dehydrogenase [ubiquinone] 1 alpha subcomplex assembly factor 1